VAFFIILSKREALISNTSTSRKEGRKRLRKERKERKKENL
jgi:hypothetical protein